MCASPGRHVTYACSAAERSVARRQRSELRRPRRSAPRIGRSDYDSPLRRGPGAPRQTNEGDEMLDGGWTTKRAPARAVVGMAIVGACGAVLLAAAPRGA